MECECAKNFDYDEVFMRYASEHKITISAAASHNLAKQSVTAESKNRISVVAPYQTKSRQGSNHE